jgi:hypothetical protein
MASLSIMEDLQVLKDRGGQLDASIPPSAIQQLGLLGALGECPGGELPGEP